MRPHDALEGENERDQPVPDGQPPGSPVAITSATTRPTARDGGSPCAPATGAARHPAQRRRPRPVPAPPAATPPHAEAAMNTGWETAAFGGRVIGSHPSAGQVTVEVLLRDHRGDGLRLLASGYTVDDAVAAAERHAARRFGSDYAHCDWRAR